MSSVSEDTALAVQTWRLEMLLEWREHLPTLAEAAKEAFGEAEVYIFGSAVEGKLTADSDIDVLVVLNHVPRSGLERAKLLDKLWRALEKRGIPPWYPFEVHLATRDELKLLEKPTLLRVL
ncbi:MAG: nucleotidyltransferase domain-containing protein [Thermofilum sp.]